ncbi:hypothetical protein [Streptomyces sp. NPDC053079]|uniref:hypothetical protein n=1 Tax=Streptomyces sp. NPDC053079 TaxID=3365697 RepID=UPI0037D47562
MRTPHVWTTCAETGADVPVIREITLAAFETPLQAAKDRGERYVTVLGHPAYYPRFGFGRASAYGIGVSFDVPDEALMALALDEAHPLPSGIVRYAAPFGI